MTRQEALELAGEAVLLLVQEPLGDKIYDVREREGKGWEGPRVLAWSAGVTKAEEAARALGWDGRYASQREKAAADG